MGGLCEQKRLYSEPVSGAKKLFGVPIPYRQCEHPPQPLKAVGAPLDESVKNDLSVAQSVKSVAQSCEIIADGLEIVYFAVEYDCMATIVGRDGLAATSHVNNT